MLFVGVFAATQGSVQMGGSVSFNATDVYARVSGSISGAGVGNTTLPTLNFDADNETPDASGWTNLDLAFDAAGSPITMVVKVENLADRGLTVNLKDNFSSTQGTIKNGSNENYTGSNVPLGAVGGGNDTTTFTITFSLTSKNNSLADTSFGFTLNLYDASYELDNVYEEIEENGQKYLLFGWYPQTVKSADVTVGSSPESNGYYLGSDGAYYMKATAKVDSGLESGYADFSDDTAIASGTEYYFKMEPLKWRILTEDYNDTGNALIVCDTIVDMVNYRTNYKNSNGHYYATDEDKTILTDETATVGQGVDSNHRVYANNYEYSEIREYLNNTFYNTAFNAEEKALIVTTTVDNSLESIFGSYTTESGYTEDTFNYECRDTEDNVFLLSLSDVNNTAYGFKDSYSDIIGGSMTPNMFDTARYFYTSDYSKAMGAETITQEMFDAQMGGMQELFGEGIIGSGMAWLRSPGGYNYGRNAFFVSIGGYCDYNDVDYDAFGVVPALQIKL